MKSSIGIALVLASFAASSLCGAETKVKFENLPSAVQKTVQAETAHATLVGLTKAVEHGKLNYEIETKVNGRSRDLSVDANGTILSVEEEVSLDSLPAVAKAAIEKKAAQGKVSKVEKVTENGKVTYEAAISVKGKKSETQIAEDGTLVK
jgi:uncharacterized membrane protein YkoI